MVSVPDAVALHRYEFSRNPAKYYLVERNRLMFVATLWSARALVVLAPPLLALELAHGRCWPCGRAGSGRRCAGGPGCGGNRREVRARRRLVQRERAVPDRVWMRVLTDQLDTPLVSLPGAVRRPLNSLMRLYWQGRLSADLTEGPSRLCSLIRDAWRERREPSLGEQPFARTVSEM